MHHLVAWQASIADATGNVDVTPVPDSIMAIQNGHFVPQVDQFIYFGTFQGLTADRARFNSASLRQMSPVWIRPITGTIVQGAEPHVADYRTNPLRIKGLEELILEGTQTTGGAAVVYGLAGLIKGGLTPAPSGNEFVMRGTGTTTLVAKAWSLTTITWQDTLPAGKYAVVGLEYFGTTAIAARLIFEEQVERAGCVATGTDISKSHEMFVGGGLGVWGYFNANRMPNLECLANAADTAEEVYLHFVRVG